MARTDVRIESLEASVFRIPTDGPEADGTLAWDHTTLVVIELAAGGRRGIGYTYANAATARLARDELEKVVVGQSPYDITRVWIDMARKTRNLGRPGITSTAMSAVDVALWDLKAKLLGIPVLTLLGAVRESIPVYGSGGFTSYDLPRLQAQLGGWVESGIPRVKMKVGTHPEDDVERVRAAREAIGRDAELFVDANGAYARKQALAMAEAFADLGVTWFEEPVTSDDLTGMRLIRDRVPAGMEISSGEYGYSEPSYFYRMLEAGAVDVLQADVTRCGGFTGFGRVAALCDAMKIPLSGHTTPSLHLHLGCAFLPMRHTEYFHDHVRIERMLFDGFREPSSGALSPDLSRPGLGLELKRKDAERFAV